MRIQPIATAAVFAAALAALPLSAAKAQYYGPPPCSPFPLAWPFCIAGAAVGAAATIATAPIRAVTGAPYYYGYYRRPYYYPPPAYYGPGYYYGPPYYYGPR